MLAAVLVLMLAGCASGPLRLPASLERDGPAPNPPADLAQVPDAEPKLEPIRPGGANKPYDVLGHGYVPITQDAPFTERGLASWYGTKFHGRRTASGEVYNMYAMTAAHKTLPIPSYARVRNPANGREIVVRINDRGPFHSARIIDLSYTAALKLDLLRGVGNVELQRITFEEIRTGAWRRDPDAVRVAANDDAAAAGSGSGAGSAPSETAAAASLVPVPAPAPVAVPAQPPTVVGAAATLDVASPRTVDVVAASANRPPAQAIASASSSGTAVDAPVAAKVEDAAPARAYTAPARGFWVQLGAFRVREGAEGFQKRVVAEMDWLSPLLAVFSDASMFRLQAGPYPNRELARSAAERVRDGLKLVPVIVERR